MKLTTREKELNEATAKGRKDAHCHLNTPTNPYTEDRMRQAYDQGYAYQRKLDADYPYYE